MIEKDGSTRLCVDNGKVNAVTSPIYHTIPTINELIDTLAANQPAWMSTTDLSAGFYNIMCTPRAKEVLAFSTHNTHATWRRMPFGATSAPSCFQRLMHACLQGLTWNICLVYLDDVLVFSQTFEEHLDHLQQVFNRFRSANLRINGKKCEFLLDELIWLGFKVSSTGVAVDERKVQAVTDFPTPRNQKQLRSFISLCSF